MLKQRENAAQPRSTHLGSRCFLLFLFSGLLVGARRDGVEQSRKEVGLQHPKKGERKPRSGCERFRNTCLSTLCVDTYLLLGLLSVGIGTRLGFLLLLLFLCLLFLSRSLGSRSDGLSIGSGSNGGLVLSDGGGRSRLEKERVATRSKFSMIWHNCGEGNSKGGIDVSPTSTCSAVD